MSSHCNRWLLFSKASWSTFHAVSSGISVSITRLNASRRDFTVELDEPLRNWTTSSKRRKKERSLFVPSSIIFSSVLQIFKSESNECRRRKIWRDIFENGIERKKKGEKKTWDSEFSKMLVNHLRKPLILNIPFRELRWNFPSQVTRSDDKSSIFIIIKYQYLSILYRDKKLRLWWESIREATCAKGSATVGVSGNPHGVKSSQRGELTC